MRNKDRIRYSSYKVAKALFNESKVKAAQRHSYHEDFSNKEVGY